MREILWIFIPLSIFLLLLYLDIKEKYESILSLKSEEEEWVDVCDLPIVIGKTSQGPACVCKNCLTKWDFCNGLSEVPVFVRGVHESHGLNHDEIVKQNYKQWEQKKNWWECPIRCQEEPITGKELRDFSNKLNPLEMKPVDIDNLKDYD